MKRRILALLAALVVSGCSLAPTYRVADSVEPTAQFKESSDWKPATPNTLLPGQWWTVFNDAELNRLQNLVITSNQDLHASLARLDQAKALMDASRASFFPSFTAQAGSTENRYSQNRPYFPTSTATSPYFHDTQAGLGVSYELDLWGRVRNAAQASSAAAEAVSAEAAVMELGIRSTLAMDYFTLRAYDAEQMLMDSAVEWGQQNLNLMQKLVEGGAASASDLALAQQQLGALKTQAADLKLKRAQTEHAIAVLVGASPSAFTLAPVTAHETDLPNLQGVLPSTLLERRPDVAAAERRMASANASIGVARAAFFPTFSLNGSAGYETTSISRWFSAPSLFWSVGPGAALSLFDGGLRQAITDQAKASYEEQVANYRNTVLHALQEVEDQLAARRQLELEYQATASSAKAATEFQHQAQLRYEGGAASYFEVVQSRLSSIQNQINLETVRLQRQNAQITLIKALGGGWQASFTATQELKP
jgi:NodT family efflux transporter outer membrane factor (OMF) lipoprotein